MKFITKDGQILDGDPLSEVQMAQRAELVEYFHSQFCRGIYHPSHERRNGQVRCESVASALVTKIQFTALNFASPPSAPYSLGLSPAAAPEEELPGVLPDPVAILPNEPSAPTAADYSF